MNHLSAILVLLSSTVSAICRDVIGIFESLAYAWSYHAYREWQGWSREMTGPLDHTMKSPNPTDREMVIIGRLKQNRPAKFE
jgi:hypothetical protein